MKLLLIHCAFSITSYTVYVSVHSNTIPAGQLHPCIYVCTNETYFLAYVSTRFNPYFDQFIIIAAKVGIMYIDLVYLLKNVFCLCMHGCNYPAGIVFA